MGKHTKEQPAWAYRAVARILGSVLSPVNNEDVLAEIVVKESGMAGISDPAALVASHAELVRACEEAHAAIGAVGIKLESTAPSWQEPLLAAFSTLQSALSTAKALTKEKL